MLQLAQEFRRRLHHNDRDVSLGSDDGNGDDEYGEN